MRLYVTPAGEWTGTEDAARTATKREGNKPGSWRKVEIPVDKTGLLAFLNSPQVALILGPDARHGAPEPTPQLKPVPSVGDRFRVYVKGLFACVVHADSSEDAREAAIGLLDVRAVTAR